MATFIFDNEGNYDLFDADDLSMNDVFKAGAYLINLAAASIMTTPQISTSREREIVLKTVLNNFYDIMNETYFGDRDDEVGVIN